MSDRVETSFFSRAPLNRFFLPINLMTETDSTFESSHILNASKKMDTVQFNIYVIIRTLPQTFESSLYPDTESYVVLSNGNPSSAP